MTSPPSRFRASFVVLAGSLALAGCSSSSDGDPASSPGTSAAGAGGSSAAGAGGSSSAGAAGTGGSAAVTPGIKRDGNKVTITMEPFVVPPGEEVYRCQNFANPFDGDVDVTRFASHMPEGSHHLLVFYKPGIADGPLAPCSGLEFTASPYSTQLPDDEVKYPAGVGAHVQKSNGFRLQSHYLNTTKEPINATVQVTLDLADPGVTLQPAGVLFMVQPSFSVPPNTKQTVTRTCKLPVDANILLASGHMHRHGTHFEASIDGKLVYQTDMWNDPKPGRFDPPMTFPAGAQIKFSCTFQNNETTPLTFGESAKTDEMCISNMQFYPLPAGSPATLDCK